MPDWVGVDILEWEDLFQRDDIYLTRQHLTVPGLVKTDFHVGFATRTSNK